jgi:DNA-binding NarL/FixJ family response regulator
MPRCLRGQRVHISHRCAVVPARGTRNARGMTDVAIVEDQAIVRESLSEWVNATAGCRCVGTFVSAEEALKRLPALAPQVVLMDIHLPGESGIVCTAKLKLALPAVQVIMVTVYNDQEKIFDALKAGASGYLLKRCGPEDVARALLEVKAGGAPMTAEIARQVVSAFHRRPQTEPEAALSRRENEILALLAEGLPNKLIADRLGISPETVNVHLRRIYEKLHVHSRTEAALRYVQSRGPRAP